MISEAKQLVLTEAVEYFRERGQELAARFYDLVERLAMLEDEDFSGQSFAWYQFFRRMRRWWNQEEIQRVTEQIKILRDDVFQNACVLTHLSAGNVSPTLELLKNDEEKFIAEGVACGLRNQQDLIHKWQEKITRAQELRQCLKSIV